MNIPVFLGDSTHLIFEAIEEKKNIYKGVLTGSEPVVVDSREIGIRSQHNLPFHQPTHISTTLVGL